MKDDTYKQKMIVIIQSLKLQTCSYLVLTYRSDSGDIVDPDEIIQALDDGTKITLAELGEVKTYVSEEDGKTHVSFILKVVQSKEMRPIIRINKVVILIIMFLGLATAVFILFFIYVLRGQG